MPIPVEYNHSIRRTISSCFETFDFQFCQSETDIRDLEATYCRDFVCCDLVLNDLHELLQHYEEYHVQIEDDILSEEEEEDDHSAFSSFSSPSISLLDDPILIGKKRKSEDEQDTSSNKRPMLMNEDFITQASVLLASTINNNEDKPYKCSIKGCDKAYKNPNGLKYHNQHGHCNNLLNEDETEKPYQCTVGDCGKRYKNLNGLKYHIEHSHINQSLLSTLLYNNFLI